MDKFLTFCLSIDDQEFLKTYLSPRGENSLLKYVPVNEVERARRLLKSIGINSRTKYRGPRTKSIYTTLKKDALHASLYKRVDYASK